jgi:hypothetical protein
MRTTLNIDDELLKEAKIAAIREGITLTEYIERALKHECRQLRSEKGQEAGTESKWTMPTRKGEPLSDFDWTASYGKMIEQLEGPFARP